MVRLAFIRYLLAHGAALLSRSEVNEVYGTKHGFAPVPLGPNVDDFVVVQTCRALKIALPRGISARPRRPAMRKEPIVLEVPPGTEILIKPKKPRGGGPGRK